MDAPNLEYFVLTGDNELMLYNAQAANVQGNRLSITGLSSGEHLLSIDFRPATGQLYAVSSASRLYVVNLATGVATAVGAEPFSPAIEGDIVSIDFNPTVDRIRLVTNSGQNLRLDPETGVVAATDGNINGASGAQIAGVAYQDNFAGATSTVLYDIDVTSNKLFKQDPPNDGTLVEVGDLGVDITAVHGFDISVYENIALATLEINGQQLLCTINLSSGAAQIVSDPISGGFRSMALPTRLVGYAVDDENVLHIVNPENMDVISKELTGMVSGDEIVGLDFRPLNGQLYALGSASRIYTVNTSSGELSPVGTAAFSTLLEGDDFGFDFNPTVDRIRIISNTGQNLRVHPETGALVEVDGRLNPDEPAATATAYTNNYPEALGSGDATTEMFVIDAATSTLFKQDPPNDGVLTAVGPLGIDVEAGSGFDISAASNSGYAILTAGGQTGLYGIDLGSGAANMIGNFPKPVKGFTVGTGIGF
ncbi:DUF4394 domain-containing protein [Olivibacter sp. SDN3]|nr:DUF4394 domain-containing protein [Olivibacter sp. SDN3]